MNSKHIILNQLGQLKEFFIAPQAKKVIQQTYSLVEHTLEYQEISEAYLSSIIETLESDNYIDFLDALESSCKLIGIQSIYFDFPIEDIRPHFYNPKIHNFLQILHHLQSEYSHIIFNQNPRIREELENVYFMSNIIYLQLEEKTYKNMSQLLEANPHLKIENIHQNDIKYQRDNSIIFSKTQAIGIASICFEETSLAARNKYAQVFLEKIIEHLHYLGNHVKI